MYSLGFPEWAPGGDGLVVTAWTNRATNFNNANVKLGFIYCYNRPSYLYYIPFPNTSENTK